MCKSIRAHAQSFRLSPTHSQHARLSAPSTAHHITSLHCTAGLFPPYRDKNNATGLQSRFLPSHTFLPLSSPRAHSLHSPLSCLLSPLSLPGRDIPVPVCPARGSFLQTSSTSAGKGASGSTEWRLPPLACQSSTLQQVLPSRPAAYAAVTCQNPLARASEHVAVCMCSGAPARTLRLVSTFLCAS